MTRASSGFAKPEPMSVFFPMRMTATQKQMLEDEAARCGVGMADVVRAALDHYFGQDLPRRRGEART